MYLYEYCMLKEGDQGMGGGGQFEKTCCLRYFNYILQGRTWSGFFLWSLTDQLPNYQAI